MLSISLFACGYRPLHASAPSDERLSVVVVANRITPSTAADDVATGMREALAESGLVRSGEGFPRAEVEIVRVDEESESIAEVAGAPVARGLRVGVVARAWVKRAPETAPTLDTGDMRAFVTVAADRDPGLGASLSFERAARAAARRVGHALGARLAGHPTVSE